MHNDPALVPAATILLLRGGAQGIEVFMIVRHHKIDAFSGALVFPGGKVDGNDADGGLRSYCRGYDSLDSHQRRLRIAAIREAFEECGILMAYAAGGKNLLSGEQSAALSGYRGALHRGELSLLELCRAYKLELALDQLRFYAHWITPRVRPKIFDTYFFIAPAPPQQIAKHDDIESSDSLWIAPQKAIHDAEKGRFTLVFPTRMNLGKIARFTTMQDVLDSVSTQSIVTVQPQVEVTERGNILSIPAEAGYEAHRVLAHQDGRQFIFLEK